MAKKPEDLVAVQTADVRMRDHVDGGLEDNSQRQHHGTVHGAAQIGAQAEVSMIARDSAAMHGAAEVGAAEVGAAERSDIGRKTSSS